MSDRLLNRTFARGVLSVAMYMATIPSIAGRRIACQGEFDSRQPVGGPVIGGATVKGKVVMMTARLIRVGIALALSLSWVAPPSYASPILDQQNTVMSSQLNGGSSAYAWQQEITAGLTGWLSSIEVFASIDVPAHGDVALTQLFVNQGNAWQSDAHDWSTIALLSPGWNIFDLTSANIFVHAGDQFVIGLQGQSAQNFEPGIGFSYGDLYAGGEHTGVRAD